MHSHSELKTLLGLWPKGKNAMINDVEKIKSVYFPLASVFFKSFSWWLVTTLWVLTKQNHAKVQWLFWSYHSRPPKFHHTPFPLFLHSLPDLHWGSSAILQWKSCEENLGQQLIQHLGHELWPFLQKKRTIFSLIAITGF